MNTFKFSTWNDQLFSRLGVPRPEGDPEQLFQQLMAFRNEWFLHRRRCDFTGKEILSAYPTGVPFPVYTNEIWWGDEWDPLEFGRAYNPSRGFFEQFAELQQVVPREGTSVFHSENCDYNGHIRESRNCYMNSLVHKCEDTHYSYWVVNNKDIVDCLMVNNSNLAYECVDCDNIFDCVGLQECYTVHDCYFSYQLRGCEYCIGCSNLVNKRYHVENRPVSEAEFRELKAQLLDGTQAGLRLGTELFQRAYTSAKHRAVHNVNTENVVGDHVLRSKNCYYCFDGSESEDVAYTISFGASRNIFGCYSVGWPACDDVYCSLVTRGSQNIAFCYYTFYSSNLRYCDSSMSSHDCFGCIGMRRARYCVLNKEYSKDDYEALVGKIISRMKETGEWGKFFPGALSTFPFNETPAIEYFPLPKEEVVQRGLKWREEETPTDRARAADTLLCEESGKPFKLIRPELDFYQKLNLPPPKFHPMTRHRHRLARRNPYRLYLRKCEETGAEIVSSFAPGRPEKVYSEQAFLEGLE